MSCWRDRGEPALLRRARRGAVRLWIPLLLLALVAIWSFERLGDTVQAAEFTTIDTRRAHLDAGLAEFVDPRWSFELQECLARLPATRVEDQVGLAAIRTAVESLPFVAQVGTPRAIWPDGCELSVRLRRPVACIQSGEGFLLVSEEGYVLPGDWPQPPRINERLLPVIGPHGKDLAGLAPGTRLHQARHVDALSVAIFLRQSLLPLDLDTLGPVLIDASQARSASVENPGVVLELENQRRILFGRAPWNGEPGELPSELKFRSIAKAAQLLRGSEHSAPQDWSVIDVRWDMPSIQTRAQPEPAKTQPRKP